MCTCHPRHNGKFLTFCDTLTICSLKHWFVTLKFKTLNHFFVLFNCFLCFQGTPKDYFQRHNGIEVIDLEGNGTMLSVPVESDQMINSLASHKNEVRSCIFSIPWQGNCCLNKETDTSSRRENNGQRGDLMALAAKPLSYFLRLQLNGSLFPEKFAHFNLSFETSSSPRATASKQTTPNIVKATTEFSLDNTE